MTEWAEFWAMALAEIKALGWSCIAHGPEVWLWICALAGAGMIACLVGAFVIPRLEDDDDERH